MLSRKYATQILDLLRELDAELDSGRVQHLRGLIDEIRDNLWQQVPFDLAKRMDVEDGLDPDRGAMWSCGDERRSAR